MLAEDDADLGEAVEMPPSVVMQKMEALLDSGTHAARYETPAGVWGVQSQLDGEWNSFAVEKNGTCHYVDEMLWCTGPADEGWTEEESDELAALKSRAEGLPNTILGKGLSFLSRRPVLPKAAIAKAAAALPAVAKSPAVSQPQKPGVAKSPAVHIAKAPAVSQRPPAPASEDGVPEFLCAVRARFQAAGSRHEYEEFLKAVAHGAHPPEIIAKLSGYGDLIAQYREAVALPPAPVSNGKPPAPKPGLGKSLAVAKTPSPSKEMPGPGQASAQTPSPSPAATPDESKSVELMLAALRELTEDLSVQLVRGVCGSMPGARATLRLSMLNYVRARVAEMEPTKELFILRGAPGVGTTAWALDRIKHRGITPEEEAIARLTHICSSDYSSMQLLRSAEEEFADRGVDTVTARSRTQVHAEIAMRSSISPLFVDDPNLCLWEMAPYVRLAQLHSYSVTVVAPEDVCGEWNDAASLAARSQGPGVRGRPVPSKEVLDEFLPLFEPLPKGVDPIPTILGAEPGVLKVMPLPSKRPATGGAEPDAKRVKASPSPAPSDEPPPLGNEAPPKVAASAAPPKPAAAMKPPQAKQQQQTPVVSFDDFAKAAKERLTAAGKKKAYKVLLQAIAQDAEEEVQVILQSVPDLAALYNSMKGAQAAEASEPAADEAPDAPMSGQAEEEPDQSAAVASSFLARLRKPAA